jgi:hypothetical protein
MPFPTIDKETSMDPARSHKLIGLIVVAVALTVPGAVALADSMDVVRTRDADAIARDFGRESGHAYWETRDAMSAPQYTQSGAPSFLATAWDKTKHGAATAWDRTKSYAAQQPAIPPDEPQRYGRAGGFIGIEQFEVPQPGVTALHSAPANADAVKTGELQWGHTDRTSAADSSRTSGEATRTNPDGMTGQSEQEPVQR